MSGKPYFAYRSFRKELAAKKDFAGIGIRQFCVFPANTINALGQPYSEYPPIWKWIGVYDFAPLDQQIEDILEFEPKAEFLFMIDLNTPPWFSRFLQCRQMPEDSFSNVSSSLTCEKWRSETMQYMDAVIQHAQGKYGPHIRCYILSCGATSEWMDYSLGAEWEGKLKAYQQWSKEKGYPVPERIPSLSERYDAPHNEGRLRDPVKNQKALRYWQFHSDLVAQGICDFAAEAKKNLSADQEIGVFYGYIMQLGTNYQVGCGHLAYEKVLHDENVDFLIAPGLYSDREMGGGGGFQNLNGAIHLAGKHYLHELDHHTHSANLELTPYAKATWWKRWPDVKADIAGLRREFGRSLIHGSSLWWFDMWGGYYQSPEVLKALEQMQKLWNGLADHQREPDSEIAVIADPASVLYNNDHLAGNEYAWIFQRVQEACNHLGAPYTLYDISNLPELKKTPKLAILPMWIELTAAKRELIAKYLPGTKPVWVGPCGLTDGKNWQQQELEGLHLTDTEHLDRDLLRKAVKDVGVHIYCSEPLPLWTDGELLSCHAAESGKRTFFLKRKAAAVTELFSERTIAENTDRFEYDFNGPETALFKI